MSNQSNYPCPICGADNMRTDFTDGFKWGRAYCNSCDCGGPEVRTGYEESFDAPWREEARKRFADVANEYAINQFADDTNVARSPWAKTSDRLPDKCNRYNMYLTIKKRGGGVWQVSGNFIKEHPELCPYWMPIPPLPEVEE